MPSALRTGFGSFASCESIKNLARSFGCEILLQIVGSEVTSMPSQEPGAQKTYVEIVVDSHHWSITACALAFHLDYGKLAILSGITGADPTKMLFDSVQDVCGAT